MQNQKLITALNSFLQSAKNLSNEWNESNDNIAELLSEKYPFDQSFDDLAFTDIQDWVNSSIEKLNSL